jgi:flagellar protein FlaF
VSAQLAAARAAYARPETASPLPRAQEYDLLARVTRRLSETARLRQQDLGAFLAALDDNLRLWSALGQAVADEANALPAPLRARLFYLYEFTARHSRAVRQGDAEADVLIDINTAVMRGLRGQEAA